MKVQSFIDSRPRRSPNLCEVCGGRHQSISWHDSKAFSVRRLRLGNLEKIDISGHPYEELSRLDATRRLSISKGAHSKFCEMNTEKKCRKSPSISFDNTLIPVPQLAISGVHSTKYPQENNSTIDDAQGRTLFDIVMILCRLSSARRAQGPHMREVLIPPANEMSILVQHQPWSLSLVTCRRSSADLLTSPTSDLMTGDKAVVVPSQFIINKWGCIRHDVYGVFI